MKIGGFTLKKYKGLFIFLSLILILILSYIGLVLLCRTFEVNTLVAILMHVLGVILVLPVFIGVHEAGHMVFGLASGFSLLTYKIGPFEWYKKDDKIAFRLNSLSSMVLGQCLMIPPKPKKKVKPKFYLYNAGGLIFSYSLDVILVLLFFLTGNGYIKHLLVPVISISVFLTLNNSIYQEGGFNDVCNHRLVKSNSKYIYSIMYQLEIIANITNGKRYGAKTLYEPYFEEKLNHITLPVAQLRFYQAIDKSDFVEAKRISDIIRKNYNNILLPVQKVSVIFVILFTDIVIEEKFTQFKRHFKWIGEKEKAICMKYDYDIRYYYDIYSKIYRDDYEIKEDVIKLINSPVLLEGEKLSLEKMMNFLVDKLDSMKKEVI